jgi:uncharacterized protein YaiI (UPF0178 family)
MPAVRRPECLRAGVQRQFRCAVLVHHNPHSDRTGRQRPRGRARQGLHLRLLRGGAWWRLMRIWVDADACPVAVKEILFRAAQRTGRELTLVANQMLRVPAGPNIRAVQVPGGFDVADAWIAERVAVGDLVVTADIPLAAEIVEKGAIALSPRGERYGKENIRELLDLRNFMDTLRSTGVQTGGPAAFGQADRQKFANQLDRLLQQAR